MLHFSRSKDTISSFFLKVVDVAISLPCCRLLLKRQQTQYILRIVFITTASIGFYVTMTTSTSDQKTKRRKASYTMPTKILFAFLGILAAASLPIPTQSFGQRFGPSSTILSYPKCTTNNYYQQPMHDSSWLSKFPSPNGRFVVSDSSTTTVALGMATKNNDDTPKGGEKVTFLDNLLEEKNRPGLIFTTCLTLWHFWIGPALRPIILEWQQ